jgi:DNA repair exonuclease SbcCD ATPase subunit
LKTQQGEYSNKIDSAENSLKSTLDSIDLYEKSKTSIEHNKLTEANITKVKSKIRTLDIDIKTANKKWMDFNSKLTSLKDQKDGIEKSIKHAKELEAEFKSYELYLKAINRDGIPYELISQSLPKIQNEVNNILSQIVEFTMELKTDGKNVLINIVYEDKKWSLGLCSGMEKFCSALALRVALMNVSSIPRSNFLSIDEGFSACDSDHMSMVQSLLSYLKTNFDFILIISHLDVMKDMVTNHLEIHKDKGFSKITNI